MNEVEFFSCHKRINDDNTNVLYDVYDVITGDIFLRIYKDNTEDMTDNNIIKSIDYSAPPFARGPNTNDPIYKELKKIINTAHYEERKMYIYKAYKPNTIKLITIFDRYNGKNNYNVPKLSELRSIERDLKIKSIIE